LISLATYIKLMKDSEMSFGDWDVPAMKTTKPNCMIVETNLADLFAM
jgi:hypothetical protein